MAHTAPTSTKHVKDARTGKVLEVRGFGALKGKLKITRGVDLTKPIYEQVSKKRSGNVAHKG